MSVPSVLPLVNGGKLKPETELIQYGTQRLAVARDGGVFGKFYSDKEVKEDSSGKKAKANIEAMKQMEDVELTLRNSGAKTRAEADKVIEEATAAGRAKQAAGEIGNQKGWFDFLKSRKKDEPVSAIGKVTEYYPSEGKKSATTGPWENKLENESLAASPDVQQELKDKGIKPFDKVKLTVQTPNGTKVVVRRYDDHTATDEEARALGLPPLRKRYDFRVPVKGASGLDDMKVVKVEKYTEDGPNKKST